MDRKQFTLGGLLARLRAGLSRGLGLAPSSPSIGAPAQTFDPHQLLTDLFVRLRQAGFNLGVPELLAAQQAVEGGWGDGDLEELAEVARLLWCKSPQDRVEFDIYWAVIAPHQGDNLPTGEDQESSGERKSTPDEDERSTPLPPAQPAPSPQPEQNVELAPLPIRTPFVPTIAGGDAAIHTYWPLSRRSMVYAWRYLRRPVADGPLEVLDVSATVSQVARQGFYLAPVYRRRERNHARLILLIDQGGSMAPLHRFTRDLVESAQNESNLLVVESYYFHNVPGDSYYLDPHLTEQIPAEQVLEQCIGETSVLIVSDAGAARGGRHMERIRATARFLASIKSHTALIAWLNPMPRQRWEKTSAQFIAGFIPMYPMDPDGMSNAIDLLRGQP